MEKLSSKLGLHNGCLIHYCPGCENIHKIPVFGDYSTLWQMEGTVNSPTVSPSVKHQYSKEVDGNIVIFVQCHYILTKGLLNFGTNDNPHKYNNQVILLPDIPEQYWPKRGN